MSDLRRQADDIGRVLGLAAPAEDTSPEDLALWIDWWHPSAELARSLPPERIAYLRAGGWWPPVPADRISRLPPAIVTRTLRPALDGGSPSRTDRGHD